MWNGDSVLFRKNREQIEKIYFLYNFEEWDSFFKVNNSSVDSLQRWSAILKEESALTICIQFLVDAYLFMSDGGKFQVRYQWVSMRIFSWASQVKLLREHKDFYYFPSVLLIVTTSGPFQKLSRIITSMHLWPPLQHNVNVKYAGCQ